MQSKYFFIKLLLIPLLFIFLFLNSCSTEEIQQEESQDTTAVIKPGIIVSKQIRVLIESNLPKKEIVFAIPTELKFEDTVLTSIGAKEKIKFEIVDQSIEVKIGKRKYVNQYFDFVPKSKQNLDYNKQTYTGKIRLAFYGSQVGLINILDLADYIKSVVSSELGKLITKQNLEAVKANIVCIRNYSEMKIKEGKEQYDVFDDERDQLYNGVVKGNSLLDDAIDVTKNQYLIYDDQIAYTFYFSSCGGFTEDCEHVFPNSAEEYLKGVKDGEGPYCKISPSFNWEENYSKKQIIELLVQANYLDSKNWNLVDIGIESRYISERVNELSIFVNNKEEESRQIIIQGNAIRTVFKTNKGKSLLKSTVFDIAVKKKKNEIDQVKFVGKGNGHGVGLCQWGAIGQAQAGKKYDEILGLYFPGTKLETLND